MSTEATFQPPKTKREVRKSPPPDDIKWVEPDWESLEWKQPAVVKKQVQGLGKPDRQAAVVSKRPPSDTGYANKKVAGVEEEKEKRGKERQRDVGPGVVRRREQEKEKPPSGVEHVPHWSTRNKEHPAGLEPGTQVSAAPSGYRQLQSPPHMTSPPRSESPVVDLADLDTACRGLPPSSEFCSVYI